VGETNFTHVQKHEPTSEISCERGGLVELVLGASGLVALETQVTTEIEPGARCVT
jgi:hypothetical protein